jgi:hypothetical protein
VKELRSVGCGCGCGLALLACGLVLPIYIAYASLRGWTPGNVERAVNEAIPLGSDRVTIEVFLDAKGWTRSFGGPKSAAFYAERASLNASNLSGVVFGEVSDPNVGPFDTGRITVMFFLDGDGKLIRSHVSVWILSF